MSTPVEPNEAVRALSEVRDRQRRAVEAGVVPQWFWTVTAVLVVAFCAGVETRRPLVVGLATIVFALGLGASVAVLVTRIPVQLRNDLVGSVGAMMIVGYVLGLVGVTIGVAFTLLALRVPYPATLASLVCAAGLVVGGPWLMRRLRTVMADRTVGGGR